MSIPTNWRALCAEIVENYCNPDEYSLVNFLNVLKKARAYLAQPEQEGPTDEELNDICIEHGFVFDDNHGEGLEILSNIVEYVLARWGRPAVEPVPLAQPEQEGQEVQLNWQPIATAPLDQMILVYRPDHYLPWCSVAPAKYESDQYASKPKPYWKSWLACRSKSDDREYPPTHWVPWPTAPANEEPSQ